jgi:hypothetical protein
MYGYSACFFRVTADSQRHKSEQPLKDTSKEFSTYNEGSSIGAFTMPCCTQDENKRLGPPFLLALRSSSGETFTARILSSKEATKAVFETLLSLLYQSLMGCFHV